MYANGYDRAIIPSTNPTTVPPPVDRAPIAPKSASSSAIPPHSAATRISPVQACVLAKTSCERNRESGLRGATSCSHSAALAAAPVIPNRIVVKLAAPRELLP